METNKMVLFTIHDWALGCFLIAVVFLVISMVMRDDAEEPILLLTTLFLVITIISGMFRKKT